MRPRIAFKTQATAMGRRSAVSFDFLNFVGREAESRCADNSISLLRIARADGFAHARMWSLSHHTRYQFNRRYSYLRCRCRRGRSQPDVDFRRERSMDRAFCSDLHQLRVLRFAQ
jgi:hypothetical protein